MDLIKPLQTIYSAMPESQTQFLTEGLTNIYGGDLEFPTVTGERPYVFSNFVESADGKVAHGDGVADARHISRFSRADSFIMGLLRAAADAIMMGANVPINEPDLTYHYDIYPPALDLYKALRRKHSQPEQAPPVFLSGSGSIVAAAQAGILTEGKVQPFIATTPDNATKVEKAFGDRVRIIATGQGRDVDLAETLRILRQEYDIKLLLTEGGPGFYGSQLKEGILNESFRTVSNLVVGFDKTPVVGILKRLEQVVKDGKSQKDLLSTIQTAVRVVKDFPLHFIEGVTFKPGQEPEFEIISERVHPEKPNFRFWRVKWLYSN